MRFLVKLSEAVSGPYSIYVEYNYSGKYTLVSTGVSLVEMLAGVSVNTEDGSTSIKIVNNAQCCSYEQIYPIGPSKPAPSATPAVTPTRTPLPSLSSVAVTPTPTRTLPVGSPSPTPTPGVTVSSVPTTPGVTPTPTSTTPIVTPSSTSSGSGACKRNPTITELLNTNVLSTSLVFKFDADNVFSMKWRILQNGSVIRSGIVSPTSSTVSVLYDAIPDGNYTFEIEGNSCTSPVNSKAFTLTTTTAPPVEVGVRNGLKTTLINGKYYDTVASRDMYIEVLPTGNIRLHVQAERSSKDGSRTCKPIILGSYCQDVPPAILAQLLSPTGTPMPVDTCEVFYAYYAAPSQGSTLKEIVEQNNKGWDTFGNFDTYARYFGGVERCTVSCYTQA